MIVKQVLVAYDRKEKFVRSVTVSIAVNLLVTARRNELLTAPSGTAISRYATHNLVTLAFDEFIINRWMHTQLRPNIAPCHLTTKMRRLLCQHIMSYYYVIRRMEQE